MGMLSLQRRDLLKRLWALILLFLVWGACVQTSVSQAQSFTWTGAGADNNWSTAGNWQGGTSPTGSDTTELRFTDASLRGSVFQDISDPFVLRNLEIGFNGDNQHFIFEGQAIRFAEYNPNDSNSAFVDAHRNQAAAFNQDWILDGALRVRANSGSTILQNQQLSGVGDLFIFGDAGFSSPGTVLINGELNHSGSVIIQANGLLQIEGSVGANVSSFVLGNDVLGSNGGHGNLRASGTINQDLVLLSAGSPHSLGTSSNLILNGRVYEGHSGYGRLDFVEGVIHFNGGIDNVPYLNIETNATVAGSGGIVMDSSAWHNLAVIGSIGSEQSILFNGFRQVNNSGVFYTSYIQGSGQINCETTLLGGGVYGSGLTFNDRLFVGDGNSEVGLGMYQSSNLVFNDEVRIERLLDETVGTGTFSGAGFLTIASGASFFGNALTVSDMDIRLESSSLRLSGSVIDGNLISDGNSAIEVLSGFPSEFNRDVKVQTGTLAIDGIVQGDGTLTIKSGAAVTLQNASSRIRLDVVNEGLIDGTTSKATIESNLFSRGGEYQGLFDCFGTMTVESSNQSVLRSGADGYIDGGTLVNDSALSIEAGAVLRGPGNLIVNGGELLVNGEVRSNTLVNQSSILLGSGSFFGDLSVNGRLGPGNSAGTIGVDGSLTLGETSVVTIEIGGSTPGLYDAIDGRGLSVLNIQGGELDLVFLDNFTPDSLSDFDIFQNFAEINGRFGGGSGGNNNFNAGDRYYFNKGSFAIEYGTSFIRLSDFQAVPEPSGALLLGCIALGLTTFRRRRELAV
jgi:hypothetical protein